MPRTRNLDGDGNFAEPKLRDWVWVDGIVEVLPGGDGDAVRIVFYATHNAVRGRKHIVRERLIMSGRTLHELVEKSRRVLAGRAP